MTAKLRPRSFSALLSITLSFPLFIALSLAASSQSKSQEAGTKKYCDDKARSVVLFIDVTTPYDEVEKQSLVDGVSQIYDTLEGGESIEIRTIEDSFVNSKRLIDECMPFCPETGFFDSMFSACTEGVVIEDRRRLASITRSKLSERLKKFVELPHSDIIRTIAMSAREFYKEDSPISIFIFSDLVENSEIITGGMLFSEANETLIEATSKNNLIPALFGADVSVFGIGRAGDSQNRSALPQEKLNKLDQFWKLYFSATGAKATIQQSLSVQ